MAEAVVVASKQPPPAPASSDAPALSKAELLQMSLKELRDLCKQRGAVTLQRRIQIGGNRVG